MTALKAATMLFALNTIVLPFSQSNAAPLDENTVSLNQISQGQLKLIAENFLNNVKNKGALEKNVNEAKTAQQNDLDQIPDGQTLLLRPRVGNLIYEFDIYAIKKNNTVYFSFLDVIDILELAVTFDPETGQGQGWFLREDWELDVDLNQGVVISNGQNITVSETDFFDENGDIFVSQEALGQWLSMGFVTDVSQQYLEINSPHPLPGVARNYRQQKNKSIRSYNNIAKLPRKKTEYDWLDINTADVRLGTRYRKLGESDATRLQTASLAVQGQALKHEAYALASGDSKENLQSVRARLSKRDEDAVLLGPLKARSYVIGDTDVSDIPLTGDAQQELGFRVSNNTLINTEFQTTDINGDAIPNWDVELYRNGILIGSQIVDDTGRYEFADAQLFAGDNLFELFFYGPQGEIRNKTINIPVNAALLATQDNTYDVSVSLSETNTYKRNQTADPDRDTPHIAARFNKVIGGTLGYVGVRNRDIEGENKTFIGAGATKIIANTIVDVNAGLDDEANAAAQVVARKNINKWNLSLRGLLQDENYTPNETTNPRIYDVLANAQRSFRFTPKTRSTVLAEAQYGEVATGDIFTAGRLGFSHQVGPVNISDTTFYETIEPSAGDTTERLDNTLSFRVNKGKVFVRGGVDYDIKPETQVDKYFSQISYRPSAKFSSDLYLDHEPDRDFSEARLNLNYNHKNFRTSPFVEIDSNDEVFAGLNLNFNVIDDPNEVMPILTSDQTVGRGMVSAFVYHDKNGNFIFDGNDEPLRDARVESVNIRRYAQTNEKGYALVKNLSGARPTDIVVDDQTLPDPFMVSADEGVSIIPSAGEIVELEFPVHLSGEVDGTVSIKQENGNVKLVKSGEVELYPLVTSKKNAMETIKGTIAYDGFYLVTQIPPGRYLMSVNDKVIDRYKAAAPKPKIIDIGYEGDMLYGYDFQLLENRKNVEMAVNYSVPDNIMALSAGRDVLYTMTVGDPKGSLLKNLVSRMAKKRVPDALFRDLELLTDDQEGGAQYTSASNSLDVLFERCEILSDYGVSCSLDIWVPHYTQNQNIQIASQ